jgi:hypothetical protein
MAEMESESGKCLTLFAKELVHLRREWVANTPLSVVGPVVYSGKHVPRTDEKAERSRLGPLTGKVVKMFNVKEPKNFGKCKKCGSSNTKRLSVLHPEFKVGHHKCLDCAAYTVWGFEIEVVETCSECKGLGYILVPGGRWGDAQVGYMDEVNCPTCVKEGRPVIGVV